MKDNSLQAAWQGMTTSPTSSDNLKKMMRENNHPAHQRIRKQLIIETIAFLFLLVVYYNIFDGDQKPIYANALLVTALVLAILHSVIGYRFSRQSISGANISEALATRIGQWRRYATWSIASRAVTATCVLFFFATVIQFTATKRWVLAGIILLFGIQLYLLARLWINRINQLKAAASAFKD